MSSTTIFATPLLGNDRDEIANMVGRIKAGVERATARTNHEQLVPVEDLAWAQSQQLPREFFQFFELQRD